LDRFLCSSPEESPEEGPEGCPEGCPEVDPEGCLRGILTYSSTRSFGGESTDSDLPSCSAGSEWSVALGKLLFLFLLLKGSAHDTYRKHGVDLGDVGRPASQKDSDPTSGCLPLVLKFDPSSSLASCCLGVVDFAC